jgi:copper(I)-binding protein
MEIDLMNVIRTIAIAGIAGTLGLSAHVPQIQAQSAGVVVEKPWARATPPAAQTGAIYFTLHNAGHSDDRLIAASTPAAKKAELHTHIMDGNIMKMRQVEAISVPAGKDVRLAPGGYHVMLMGLNGPLKQGSEIQLTLTFEKAGKVTVTTPVMAAGAMGPGGDGRGGDAMGGHGAGMGGMGGMSH